MIATLKFLAGFVSNAATQSTRCVWNFVRFALLFPLGLSLALLSILQMCGGGKDQGKKTWSKAWGAIKLSLKCGCFAAIQAAAVASILSPLLRGAQACAEDIAPKGLFVPNQGPRTTAQVILGLNSWKKAERDEPAPTIKLTRPIKQQPIKQQEQPHKEAVPEPTKNKMKLLGNPKPKDKKKEKHEEEWNSLVDQYINAKTMREMDSARIKMAVRYPAKYAAALASVTRKKSKKAA